MARDLEARLNAGFIGLVGFLELLEEFQGSLGKFLHLRELILVDDFPVLDGVLVIAAEIIEQGHESSRLIIGESRGGGE